MREQGSKSGNFDACTRVQWSKSTDFDRCTREQGSKSGDLGHCTRVQGSKSAKSDGCTRVQRSKSADLGACTREQWSKSGDFDPCTRVQRPKSGDFGHQTRASTSNLWFRRQRTENEVAICRFQCPNTWASPGIRNFWEGKVPQAGFIALLPFGNSKGIVPVARHVVPCGSWPDSLIVALRP